MSLSITSTCVGGRYVAAGQETPQPAKPKPITDAERFATLTKRERQVLDRYMELEMGKLVANELGISIKTFEQHMLSIREKTGYHRYIGLARAYERERSKS